MVDSSSHEAHELSFREKQELVVALLACPTMREQGRRAVLIEQLRPEIAHSIPASTVDNMHVLNVLNTCLIHEGGVQELLERLRFFEGNALPIQRLEALVRSLLGITGSPIPTPMPNPGYHVSEHNQEHGQQIEENATTPSEATASRNFEINRPIKTIQLVGRAEELKLFSMLLDDQLGLYGSMLMIHGIGGTGKTALLHTYCLKCEQRGVLGIYIDMPQMETILDLTYFIKDELKRNEVNLSNFVGCVAEYSRLQKYLLEHSTIPVDTIAALSRGIIDEYSTKGVSSLLRTPVSQSELRGAINDITRLLAGDEAQFFLEPEAQFLRALVGDINNYANKSQIVLALDTFETVSPVMDKWIRTGLFEKVDKNVLFVIAGRIPLADEWTKWYTRIHFLDIGPLRDEDSMQVLLNHGIIEPFIIEGLIEFSDGLPLALVMAADLMQLYGIKHMARIKQDIIENIVEVLLREADRELYDILEAAAILRTYNSDSLGCITNLPQSTIAGFLKDSKKLSFVIPREGGWALHDRVREYVNARLRRWSPYKWRLLHEEAVRFYRSDEFMKSARSKDDIIASILHHLLRADEEEGISLFKEEFENAYRVHKFEYCEYILKDLESMEIAHELTTILRQFYRGEILFFEGRWEELSQLFQQILDQFLVEESMQAQILYVLGTAQYRKGNNEDALKLMLDSRDLKLKLGDLSGLEDLYLTIGKIYRLEGKWALSIENSRKSLEIAQKNNNLVDEAWAVFSLAFICALRHELDDAEGYYRRSLEIFKSLKDKYGEARIITGLGDVLCLQEKYTEAIRYHRRAIAVLEELPDKLTLGVCYRRLGDAYSLIGEFDSAEQYFKKCINLSEQHRGLPYMGVAYLKYGIHLYRIGQFDRAREYYEKSEEIVAKQSSTGNRSDAYHAAILFYYQGLLLKQRGGKRDAKQKLSISLDIMRQLECIYHYQLIANELDSIDLQD